MNTQNAITVPWMFLLGKTSTFLLVLLVLCGILQSDCTLDPSDRGDSLEYWNEEPNSLTSAASPANPTQIMDTLVKQLRQIALPLHHQNDLQETVGFNLILDSKSESLATPSPVLSWTHDLRASSYSVAIDDSEECSSPLYQTKVTTNQLRVPIFLENGSYWACISAVTLTGESLGSTDSQFSITAEGVGSAEDFLGHQSTPRYGRFSPPDQGLVQEILGNHSTFWSRPDASQPSPPSQDSVGFFRHFSWITDPNDDWKIKLLVVDQIWNRLLVFSKYPESDDTLPDLVLGQQTFDDPEPNHTLEVSASTLNRPSHVSVCTDGRLLVTDTGNHRILIWNQIPQDSFVPADFVIGQENFETAASGVGPYKLNQPVAAFCTHQGILVSDGGNHRVLLFSRQDYRKARLVIGQPDFFANKPSCSQSSLGRVEDLWIDGNQLLIADTSHHRILFFGTFPTHNGAKAQKVLGQTSFERCLPNQGLPNNSVSNDTLHEPSSLAIRDGVLAVSDRKNKRILFYHWNHRFPKEAYDVFGQRDFGLMSATTKASLLTSPFGLGASDLHGVSFVKNGLWTIDQTIGRLIKLSL